MCRQRALEAEIFLRADETASEEHGPDAIDSGAGKGTDVMLTLPARLAYTERTHGWRSHLPWRYARERMDANG